MRFLQASTKRFRRLALMLACAALGTTALTAECDAAGWRVAAHDGFARLVFDTPTTPRFQASIENNKLTVTFKDPLPQGFGASQIAGIAAYLRNPQISDDRLTASFDVARPVTLRSFVGDTGAVIDLVEQTGAAQAGPGANSQAGGAGRAEVAAATPASGETVAVRVGQYDTYTRIVFEWDKPVDYKVSSDAGVARISFVRPGVVDVATTRKRLPKSVGAFDTQNTASGLTVAMTIPANAKLRDQRSGNLLIVDVMAPPETAAVATPTQLFQPNQAAEAVAPAPAKTAAKPEAAPKPEPVAKADAAKPSLATISAAPATPPAPTQAALPAPLPVESAIDLAVEYSTANGPTLKFPFPSLTGAAVYLRGNYMYVAFDRPVRFDFASFRVVPKGSTAKPPAGPEQLAVSDGAALRMPVAAGTIPQVTLEGTSWVIALARKPSRRPDLAVQTNADQYGSPNSSVRIDTDNAKLAIDVPDPDMGESLSVVPITAYGRGIEKERQFAQFSLLPSVQGVVVQRRADTVSVTASAKQTQIGGSNGVALSRDNAGPRRIFDFARWLQPDVDFAETRQLLQRNIADADEKYRQNARFELAQFFVARNHSADAIGLLDLISLDPARANDPAVKAMRGAGRVLMGDGATALNDLNDPRLDREPEMAWWRGLAFAQTENWAKADEIFRRAGNLPLAYPIEIRARMLLAAAESAMNDNDTGRARAVMQDFPSGSAPDYLSQRADYLRAQLRLAAGDSLSALPILDDLVDRGDNWARSHAEVLRVNQLLDSKAIKPDEAVARLERIRFAWSGGDLEYGILRRLGDLYFDIGKPRDGLQRLREATTYFSTKPDVADVKAHMVDRFVGLYADNASDSIPALSALAVYDDFRDLTPQGPRGDLMIQRLADRLVKIDLLDRAAELLDYQIRNRLTGVERARVGARLAVVELADHKPSDAMTALEFSDTTNMPTELASNRKRLKARAMLEQGNIEGAIVELSTENDRDSDMLRSEIYARDKQWGKAAEVLARLVGRPEQGEWDAAREKQLVNLAIALILANDDASVRKLNTDFADKLTSGPNKDAFSMLTSGGAPTRGTDVAALSVRFNELTQFQSSMTAYRETLRSGKLSALN